MQNHWVKPQNRITLQNDFAVQLSRMTEQCDSASAFTHDPGEPRRGRLALNEVSNGVAGR